MNGARRSADRRTLVNGPLDLLWVGGDSHITTNFISGFDSS